MKIKLNKNILTLLLAVMVCSIAGAQGATPPPPMPPPPPGLPIDGGLVMLLIAGLFFGAYRAYRFSNKPQS